MARRRKANRKKKPTKFPGAGLPELQCNVAGIDIGSREHWAAAPPNEGMANVLKFGSTTPELEMMADWLQAQGIESVAMESTGVYWIPAYELLESRGLEVILVNAREVSY